MWQVALTKRASKQVAELPSRVKDALQRLLLEIRLTGPVRGNWSNYSSLADGRHHCHLKKGRPTYVAVWREEAEKIKLVEVVYVGTHEKAPY